MHLMQSTYNNFRTHNNLHTNNVKTPPTKKTQPASRRLAETHRRQAIQPKQEQSHATDEPPGCRDWTARRFLEKSQKLDQTMQKQMANGAVSIKQGTTQYTYI